MNALLRERHGSKRIMRTDQLRQRWRWWHHQRIRAPILLHNRKKVHFAKIVIIHASREGKGIATQSIEIHNWNEFQMKWKCFLPLFPDIEIGLRSTKISSYQVVLSKTKHSCSVLKSISNVVIQSTLQTPIVWCMISLWFEVFCLPMSFHVIPHIMRS